MSEQLGVSPSLSVSTSPHLLPLSSHSFDQSSKTDTTPGHLLGCPAHLYLAEFSVWVSEKS